MHLSVSCWLSKFTGQSLFWSIILTTAPDLTASAAEKKAPMPVMKKPFYAAAVLLALAGTAKGGTLPQPAAAIPESELAAAERALERSATRQRSLSDAAAALTSEQEELSRQLVDAAARIKAREAMIVASRTKLAELSEAESTQRLGLAHRNDQLARLL